MRDLKLMIKHTFKESYKTMLILNGILFVSMLGIAIFALVANESFLSTPIGAFFMVMGIILIVVLLYAAMGGMVYTVYKTMNQKLFTDEGYLTLTLPVSVDSIIISKVLVNLIWIIIFSITAFLGIFAIIELIAMKNLNEFLSIGMMLKELLGNINVLENIKFVEILGAIFNLLMMLIISIVSLLLFFNILAFVNTGKLKKGRSAIAIIVYIFGGELLIMILAFITQFGAIGIAYDASKAKYVLSFGYLTNTPYLINFTSLIVYGGTMVGLYFLARFMLKKKIELI